MSSSERESGGSDDTLAAGPLTSPTDTRARRAPRMSIPDYDVGKVIGLGGMGEIVLARDPEIGRDVAIKRLRAAAPSKETLDRFLREAKIQARLDHPAIVPVYELGQDADGRPYFVMKRLVGTTLFERLGTADVSAQRLLRAFIDVCHALDFAHERGVVHRDLKPSNIMLGNYGEVYVIDWGVARVTGEVDGAWAGVEIATLEGETQAGALLGTPGYMAPEQVRGEEVTPAADIYALGCILFEILAGDSLHPHSAAAIQSTLSTPAQAPSARAKDRTIAPELDTICTAALAAVSSERPSARELADRIERYLDGDRDLERRRTLAADHVARAQVAASDPQRRAEAIRDAGRALALDPESADAATLVMTLMLEPPAELPKQLASYLDDVDHEAAIQSARRGSFALASTVVLIPFALWAGIMDGWLFFAIYAVIGGMSLDAYLQSRRDYTTELTPLILGAVLIGLANRLFGPFVVVPLVVCAMVATASAQPRLVKHTWFVLGVGLAAFLIPVALEVLGVIAPTWAIVNSHVEVTSQLIHLGGTATSVFLIGTNVVVLIALSAFLRSVTSDRRDARYQLEVQAWQLRQLLPVPPPSPELAALVAEDCA